MKRQSGTRCSTRAHTQRRGAAAPALALVLATLLVPPARLAAEEKDDPFQGALFRAELVMSHQEAIGLTKDQRDQIVQAMQRLQSAVVPSQLALGAAGERLLSILRGPRVDVEDALVEAAEALRLENQVKLEQVRFLIAVKNLLTPEQQATLERIRAGS